MRKLLILPLLSIAAACDGRSGPTGDAQLTAAEAAELSRAMFGMVSDLAGSTGIPGASFNAAPMQQLGNTFTVPIEETVPCTPSGSIGLEGTLSMAFDEVSQGITMEAEISATPAACAYRMENGDIIKTTGDPDLDVHIQMAGTVDQLNSLKVTETGAFTWTRGGASGRCTVNIASSLNVPTQVVTVTGSFCGFPVNETVPLAE